MFYEGRQTIFNHSVSIFFKQNNLNYEIEQILGTIFII